jgi:ferric-dicitrate binding protein FerR (iron transport regulator)
MSRELFEKYLRDELSDPEKAELARILRDEAASRDFVEYVQEWTAMADVARRLGAAPRAAVRSSIRRRGPASAGGLWIAGAAAAVLCAIALAFALRPSPRPSPPVLTKSPVDFVNIPAEPQPAPELPRPEALRSLPVLTKQPVDFVSPPKEEPVPPKPEPPSPPVPKAEPPSPPRPTAVAVAEVERVQGEARRADGTPLKAGEPLFADQAFATGKGGRAALRWPDGTRLEAEADSEVESLAPRGALLKRGAFALAAAKQAPGHPFVLATPHAEATVLGTRFTLEVSASATRLEVQEGRVGFRRRSEGPTLTVLPAHSAVAEKGTRFESKLNPDGLTRVFQDGLDGYAGTSDTQIFEGEPARNYGARRDVEVDGDETGKSVAALLRWDLTSIPPGSRILSAKLSVHVTNGSKDAGYPIYALRRAWGESEATWLRPWRNAGARGPEDRAPEALGTLAPREAGEVAVLFLDPALAVLQAWVARPSLNHGFLIVNEANSDGITFESREASAPARRPKLTVSYLPPAK